MKTCPIVHAYLVCVYLKVIGLLLGQQGGYTKLRCFLCEWDSKVKYFRRSLKSWSPLSRMIVIVSVIVNSKLLKRHSKAKRREPAYSRALRQIRGFFQ